MQYTRKCAIFKVYTYEHFNGVFYFDALSKTINDDNNLTAKKTSMCMVNLMKIVAKSGNVEIMEDVD